MLAAVFSSSSIPSISGSILETQREIPLAHEVDVAIVGGGTGAVAAAVAAAEAGASVFLAAPKTYLGEDVAGTLRLWLNENETPSNALAERLFLVPPEDNVLREDEMALPFTYEANLPSADLHKDTHPPTRLADGAWSSAVRDSVQYDGDVEITADLGETVPFCRAHLLIFHRSDFQVHSVRIDTSVDGKTWTLATLIQNDYPGQDSVDEPALPLVAELGCPTRHVRFSIRRAPGSTRILLGEIILTRSSGADLSSNAPRPMPKPLHVKRELDKALLEHDVAFLYACYATDLLVDETGRACGFIMVNRAGRQAVRSKVVVDATSRAHLARQAGLPFRPFPAEAYAIHRVIVGSAPGPNDDIQAEQILPSFRKGYQTYPLYDCTLKMLLKDASYASLAEMEQYARDVTYTEGLVLGADHVTVLFKDRLIGRQSSTGPWKGADQIPLEACQSQEQKGLYVLGPSADVSDEQALELSRPLGFMDLGERVGQAAAQDAASTKIHGLPRISGISSSASRTGEVREILDGVRPFLDPPKIQLEGKDLPILGEYDVVVIGGGTSGAPAGIAAARDGAKTLVVEFLDGLGGVGTLGAISKYYWGNRVGFTQEVPGGADWSIQERMEWWRKELRKAGAEIWFGALGCGAWVVNGEVQGAVVATPHGRGIVKAHVVIDATGNADIAAAAGADCIHTDGRFLAVQGTGLPQMELGARYVNTDFTIVDETDMLDVWHVFLYTRVKGRDAFDTGQLIDTRERRRIVGEYTLSVIDQWIGRTYPDTIVEAYSNFDTHGYTIHPFFALINPDKEGWRTYIPYRALLPRGLENLLVTGLAVSAERDAIPVIRMQPDIQNQGYAAGLAASMACSLGCTLRDLDIRALQKRLIELGNLKPEVLGHDEGPILSDLQLQEAIESLLQGKKDHVARIFACPERVLPLLRSTYTRVSKKEEKLSCARALALLGDNTGIDDLLGEIQSFEAWDEGWDYRSAGQFGMNMSPLDALIYAMGNTRDPRALPVLLDKLSQLNEEQAFSHHRAICVALEAIGDAQAAPSLARLLLSPGYRHHAVTSVQMAIRREELEPRWATTGPRSKAIRELLLARALYRCGDHDHLGRTVLEEYVRDLRGHLARHAHAVLHGE